MELTAKLPSGYKAVNLSATGSILERLISGKYKTLVSSSTAIDGHGKAIFELNHYGAPGRVISTEFSVSGYDSTGVEWEGYARKDFRLVTVRRGQSPPVREVSVELSRKPRTIRFSLSAELVGALIALPKGGFISEDIDELLTCLRSNLPSASFSMLGKVYDGLIKLRGQHEDWWNADWDTMSLGALLNVGEVKIKLKAAIGDSGLKRLTASGVVMRNFGAHQKFERVSMDEALASTSVLFEFIPRWLSSNNNVNVRR